MSTPASFSPVFARALTESERAIDILGIDAKLERTKDALEQAVEREKARAIHSLLGGGSHRLLVTEAMVELLRELFVFGRREAYAELGRLGYSDRRVLAVARVPDELPEDERKRILGIIRPLLGQIGIRIEEDHSALSADLGAVSENAIAQALMRLPGARDAASRVVSTAFTAGLSATFEANEELVGGWEYTSVLDDGRCEVCRGFHGRTYRTWVEAQVDLPGGGPNPSCLGGSRCRCRLVPLPA